MNAIPGQANYRVWDAVDREDGSALTATAVNYYLQALNGPNAGMWFRGSDSTWQSAESVAGAMTWLGSSVASSRWGISVPTAAWANGVTYSEYGMDVNNVAVPYSEEFLCAYTTPVGPGANPTTLVLENSDGSPVADALVWLSTDATGTIVVAGPLITNTSGQVTFYLTTGQTYYRWAQKSGENFSNPQAFTAT